MNIFAGHTAEHRRGAMCRYVGLVLFILSFLIAPGGAAAQSKAEGELFKISGRVTDTISGNPVELATFLLDGTQSAMTDKEGRFTLTGVRAGEHTYVVFALGYKTLESDVSVKDDMTDFDVSMNPLNFGLEEVVVTAVPVAMGSSSVINEDAIRHIQPKSLDDMLQLLPGSLVKNPNLNTIGQAAVREISSDANNAMGTAIILDGAPLSNDGNMQALAPTLAGSKTNTSNNGMAQQSASAGGVDMRTISADNVESLEVIRGIPCVEYGNLTSGVVVVKTKAGVTPWEVKFKADPFSKMAYAGKGFALKGGGAVNAGVDWSQSFGDTRRRYMGYDRITGSLGYSNVFNASSRPFVFNLRASFYSNVNNQRKDPQMDVLGETFTNSNIGGRLSVEGDWKVSGAAVSNVGYSLSASVSHQNDRLHSYVASPNGVVTNTLEPGVAEALILRQTYYADYRIDGVPVNVFGVIKANKLFQFLDHSYTNVKIGVDWRLDMNKGRGVVYDIHTPPQMGGAQTLRPRVFRDIPALHNLSFFAEDKSSVEIAGHTQLQFQAGIRLTQMFLDRARCGQNGMFLVEPRVNLSYEILNRDNNRIFDEFSITGGWGISHKAPSMLYLYPDYAYFDNVGLSYVGSEDNSMALVSTDVITSTANASLKPARSRKWEAGLSFQIKQFSGVVTYFDERHTDEFGFSAVPHFSHFNRYQVPTGATELSFDAASGALSYLGKDGGRHTAETVGDTLLLTYNVPDNNYMTKKRGIEYTLNFGQIRPIRTSVIVDGAWFRVERRRTKSSVSSIRNNYPYLRCMPAGSGSIESRVNTNFRFITHIPKLRLVFSTTVQVVWYESCQNIYSRGENLFAQTADGKNLYVAPEGFYDKAGNYTEWQPGFETQSRYGEMIPKYMLTAFDKEVFRPWVMLNFRMTKELGRMLELSFTANNFTNSSRWHAYRYKTGYKQVYPDMYFGAELKIKINARK